MMDIGDPARRKRRSSLVLPVASSTPKLRDVSTATAATAHEGQENSSRYKRAARDPQDRAPPFAKRRRNVRHREVTCEMFGWRAQRCSRGGWGDAASSRPHFLSPCPCVHRGSCS